MATSPLRIDGIIAAVFSPFSESGELDVSVLPAFYKYLNSTGVEWVFVGGTTGESLSLTQQERKDLLKAWLDLSSNVIAHVGADCVLDARDLAKHAESLGASAVAAMPPVFFSPANAHALALTISSICAAAPTLPCYYYHIPSMSHYTQPMFDFVKEIEPMAPNFAGIKYTGLYNNPGYMDVMRILNYKHGKYEVFSGREEMMLEGLAIGLKGHVGSQFNFAGDLYNSIRNGFAAHGIVPSSAGYLRSLQMDAIDLISAWQAAPPGVNGAKYFMNLAGIKVGDARLPSIPLSVSVAKELITAFTDFCSQSQNTKLLMCQ